MNIRRLRRIEPEHIEALAEVLIDCVEGGSSVSFMLPLTRERAAAYWRRVADDIGNRILLVAEDEKGICGTVQIVFAEPENQPHRADIAKMIVHRRARRQGIATALMREAEIAARQAGKTLLVLDTADVTAERVYERTGWTRVGKIPNYALMPDGKPCPTVFFYRDLTKEPSDKRRLENIQPILRVSDMARSLVFYVDILGFTNAEWGSDWFTFLSRDKCGLYLCKDGQGSPGTWIWSGVDDVEKFYDELRARGAKIRVPPRNYPWALEMHVEDPDGHVIRFGSEPKNDRPFEEFIP